MATASAQVNAVYQITSKDGTNITLTKVGENHPGDIPLPTTLTFAHAGNGFWGVANGPERYTLGFDRSS